MPYTSGDKRVPGIRLNVAWNCTGSLSSALIAFLLTPFILSALGDTGYGLWMLIGSLTGCFGLLDLGIRGALARQLAVHVARRDAQSISATLSTALALLCGACAVAMVGVVALEVLFFHFFAVSQEWEASVRVALAIAGFNLAIYFPLNAFDATLWAAQRFNRLNQIDISVAVLKAILICLFLRSSNGLIAIVLITTAGALTSGGLKIAATWSVYHGLRVGPRFVSRAALHDICSFGLWNFTGSLANQLTARIPAIVIGSLISPAAVTPFAIADRLVTFSSALFAAMTGVCTPRSAAYFAVEDVQGQRELFLQGGRLCWAMALFTAVAMCLFGYPFILFWLGPAHTQASWYLAILALGALIPLSQSLTRCVLLGIARHQFLAVILIGQAIASAVLSAFAAVHYGALAVCVALAIVAMASGLAQAWHGCRTLGVPLHEYAREAIMPATATCAIPIVAGVAMVVAGASPPRPVVVAQMTTYSLLFAVCFYATCLRPLRGVSQCAGPE